MKATKKKKTNRNGVWRGHKVSEAKYCLNKRGEKLQVIQPPWGKYIPKMDQISLYKLKANYR